MKKSILLTLFTIPALTCFTQIRTSESDTIRIKKLLTELTKTSKPRNYQNVDQLNETASFIFEQFQQSADTVFYQTYLVRGITYKNVIARFGDAQSERLIIGAHYDVCGNQEGADDNASGIVGLLELARMLKEQKTQKSVELVAYTLEEPPYFRTEYMGSFIHAKSLKDSNAKVSGMICLEMIGYFKDEKRTQDYPIGFLKLFYGSRGNYITVVNKFSKGKAARKFTKKMDRFTTLPVKKFNGPKSLTGIDFSDHLNYWKMGYSACMVTDTAFYRNKNYHQKTDEMGTLNISKMASVINGIFLSILA
ncbi:M28 family peptidase [Fluviicola sp.]|uniref:M28 family peptidase n=1 Tax=Fluviicola sp. TaxID=1917219 RepID=UPI0026308118|nr:M28 family peptidase [Fluviicola sp.]